MKKKIIALCGSNKKKSLQGDLDNETPPEKIIEF
jgi:hypothetical protein